MANDTTRMEAKEEHIAAAVAKRDREWMEALHPGNQQSMLGKAFSTPAEYAGFAQAGKEIQRECMEYYGKLGTKLRRRTRKLAEMRAKLARWKERHGDSADELMNLHCENGTLCGQVTSLQRELAEARGLLNAAYQYIGSDMTSQLLKERIRKFFAPAPSDVEGEEPAARGEPGLKKLPDKVHVWEETGEVRHVNCGEFYMLPDADEIFQLASPRSTRQYKVMRKLDPALYAIPDGGERIKELEAELADWKADTADQLCVNCSDPLEYQGRADAAAVADAERLRKAIETHQRTLNPTGDGAVNEVHNKLWSALSPSPAAASGEKRPDTCIAHIVQYPECCTCPECQKLRPLTLKALATLTPMVTADIDRLAGERDALSARLAACEERCKELEGGARQILNCMSADAGCECIRCKAIRNLWSLLATKAGGEDAVV